MGVRIEPKMGTMRLFLKVVMKRRQQEAKLKIQRGVLGARLQNALCDTVMQRASTPKGPMIDKQMRLNQKGANFPSREKKLFVSPRKRSMAKMPKKGTKTPVKIKPIEARIVCPSDKWPTSIGNTRFPDPKNIENMARPVERIIALFFMKKGLLDINYGTFFSFSQGN